MTGLNALKELQRFDEFHEFRQASSKNQTEKVTHTGDDATVTTTPEETLEQAYQQLRDEVANELLYLVKNNTPEFFEKLVVHLIVSMGYGGSVKEAGRATRKTADEGIDGVIKEDRLGLETIYLQAKRWEAPVGRPEIQKLEVKASTVDMKPPPRPPGNPRYKHIGLRKF